MARVALDQISKVFEGPKGGALPAVQSLDLVVHDGELLVLLGPSGSGKSTTLRLLAGFEEPTAGTISIDGVVVNSMRPKDRDIAMVFQNQALYPHLTAYENMALGLKLRKVPAPEIVGRVNEAAEMLGIRPCLQRRPKELSGGERQRVAVGRALVRRPKVFLFDEPLSNLDGPLRAQLRAQIARLHAQLGATMLYVTHDQEEAMTLADRIAVMKAGQIQQLDAPLEIYRRPRNRFVAGFIGSPAMNFLRGTLARKGYTLFFRDHPDGSGAAQETLCLRVADEATAKLTGYIDRELLLGIRPEHIRVGDKNEGEWFWSTVQLVEPLGANTCVHLATGTHQFIARVEACANVKAGEKVPVTFDARRLYFFDLATEQSVG